MLKPRIFLGHAHRDRRLIERIAEGLTARGADVILDEATIFLGDSLLERVAQTIGDSGYIAVVLSRKSVASKWVQEELRALAQTRASGTGIIPLLVEDCDVPDFLEDMVYADFRRPEAYRENLDLLIRRLGLPDDPSPMLKAGGMEWPIRDEQFEPTAILQLNLVFFDGSRFATGGGRVPSDLYVSDRTRLAELPVLWMAQQLSLDLKNGECRYVRLREETGLLTASDLRPQRRLRSEDVKSGDRLVFAVGAGALASTETIRSGVEEWLRVQKP